MEIINMANETSDPKYKIVDQGSIVEKNSENARIKTVTYNKVLTRPSRRPTCRPRMLRTSALARFRPTSQPRPPKDLA
jgi:hypothetical protein